MKQQIFQYVNDLNGAGTKVIMKLNELLATGARIVSIDMCAVKNAITKCSSYDESVVTTVVVEAPDDGGTD